MAASRSISTPVLTFVRTALVDQGRKSLVWGRHRAEDRDVNGSTEVEVFSEDEVEGLPDVVRRYLVGSIAPGAPLVRGVRLTMHGRIRVRRWLSFSAKEVLDPHRGFVWTARVAHGLITGSDWYLKGAGSMRWTLLRMLRVAMADGPDVSRSSAGRAAAEAVLAPVSLLPRFGVGWEADSPRSATASWSLDGTPIDLRCWFDDAARLRSISFERWGDPEATGTWGWQRFGGEVGDHRTFGALTVPTTGRVGWHPASDRWAQGEFFRYEVTSLEPRVWADPVTPAAVEAELLAGDEDVVDVEAPCAIELDEPLADERLEASLVALGATDARRW
jgi:hypothetical protein